MLTGWPSWQSNLLPRDRNFDKSFSTLSCGKVQQLGSYIKKVYFSALGVQDLCVLLSEWAGSKPYVGELDIDTWGISQIWWNTHILL